MRKAADLLDQRADRYYDLERNCYMSISDLGAYYGSQGVAANPWAPYTLATSGSFDSASWGSPQSVTLPNSYSTATGDCIFFCFAYSGSTFPTVTGCGATWTNYAGGANPRTGIAVGYGCTSGGTSISVANIGGQAGSSITLVFKDVKSASTPVAFQGGPTSNSGGNLTIVSSGTTVAQQLCVLTGGTNTTGSWSAGAGSTLNSVAMTNIGIDNNQRALRVDGLVIVTGSTNPNGLVQPSNGSNIVGNFVIINHA